ncbi:2Fe-2S iron-sulfur cluster-binding protein [Stutzerimonas stutzeri]|uniref:2Fe-2S iron-sulfur cluster binding domain-containing protein n=1 Tax=Stutzerimonas stutzeri TaxID=316 RepID=A0A6I6LXX6_STUST|nr:2Fe-2S iron-sulfur cluster-binding protein [Stutzerimonas stutzeri]QGZ31201.1 2Fe-2S iron-sulfur cluster binding domain-containing protein [Stutzerimonas stutzeri]
MGILIVENREGEQMTLQAEASQNLMEIMRSGGVDEILALCGGTCSCATCHIFVDPMFAELLEPMGADENDLLDSSDHRNATSRLSCQVIWREDLDGLRVTLAPED